jgi:hypothetical protein
MVASFSQIQPYIIQSESSGQNLPSSANYDYPNSTASGYYQITNSTWAGIPSSITGGSTSAYQASYAQQTAAAEYLWNTNNGADWINYNSTVANANNSLQAGLQPAFQVSPTVSNLIAQNSGSTDGTLSTPYGGGGETAPGTTAPAASTGAASSSGFGALGGTLDTIGQYVGNFIVRWGLVAAGIVLVAAAAWALSEGDVQVPKVLKKLPPIPDV